MWSLEKSIWEGLIEIANGAPIKTVVQEMMGKVPDGVMGDAGARDWYKIGGVFVFLL